MFTYFLTVIPYLRVTELLTSSYVGTWTIPGGHLEFGESFEQCASRELEEETGLQVPLEKMRYLTTINTVFEEKGKTYHFVTVAVGCELPEGVQPVVRSQRFFIPLLMNCTEN